MFVTVTPMVTAIIIITVYAIVIITDITFQRLCLCYHGIFRYLTLLHKSHLLTTKAISLLTHLFYFNFSGFDSFTRNCNGTAIIHRKLKLTSSAIFQIQCVCNRLSGIKTRLSAFEKEIDTRIYTGVIKNQLMFPGRNVKLIGRISR